MHSTLDAKSPRRSHGRRLALWAGLSVAGLLPATGCQVEYAGMTLPSGKYMHDDVQYFPPGPNFPWANTQAATQRARMQQMGIDVPPIVDTGPVAPPRAAGALPVGNVNQAGGVPNINVQINPPGGDNPPGIGADADPNAGKVPQPPPPGDSPTAPDEPK